MAMCSIENVKRQQRRMRTTLMHAKEATSRRTRRATGFSKHSAIRQIVPTWSTDPFVIPVRPFFFKCHSLTRYIFCNACVAACACCLLLALLFSGWRKDQKNSILIESELYHLWYPTLYQPYSTSIALSTGIFCLDTYLRLNCCTIICSISWYASSTVVMFFSFSLTLCSQSRSLRRGWSFIHPLYLRVMYQSKNVLFFHLF